MSDLLNQASLVMVPSGYKEDTVYSVVPTDGSGDLSFTRASNGTRVNSAGLVEGCPWNLLQYSEELGNGIAWQTLNSIIVTNNSTTAPNGTTTADTLTDASSGSSLVRQFDYNVVAGQTYTFSVYLKKASGNPLSRLRIEQNQAPYNNTIVDITPTNEWVRYSVTRTIEAGTSSVNYSIFPDINADDSVYAWGAMVNIGSTAKPYFPTTDRLNVPRLTYQNGGGGCPSLLLEKQSTNLVLNSQDLTAASWTTSNNTTTANYATSPDGTSNATRIIPNTNNSAHPTYTVITISSATSITAFAKADGYNFFQIYGGEASGVSGSSARFSVVVNLSNGTIDTIDTITSSQVVISAMNNGWYKITIANFTQFTSGNYFIAVSAVNASGLTRNSVLDVSFAGNGTSGVLAYGIQVEQSSYPTSYIPTTSSSATRVADACYKTGISSLIGQTAGTIFLEMTPVGLVTTYTERLIKVYGGGQEIGLQRYADSRLVGYGYLGGASNEWTFDIANVFTSTTQSVKIAMAYASNDVVIYVNGVQKSTDSSASMFSSLSAFTFAEDITGDLLCSQNIKQAVFFKSRLTNAELASITTI